MPHPLVTAPRVCALALCLLTLGGLAPRPSSAHSAYTIIGIDLPEGQYGSSAALNHFGQIVGNYQAIVNGNAVAGAFLYDGSSVTELGSLGGTFNSPQQLYTKAAALNDAGQIAGSSNTPDNASHAFLSTGGLLQDLGSFGGDYSDGLGINNLGQVTGYAYPPPNTSWHAFLYAGGSMQDLTGGSAYADGINDAGQIVGDQASHAFLFTPGLGMQDLGDLGGGDSSAYAVNSLGQVAGRAATSSYDFHAFLFTPGQGMTDLGILGLGGSPESSTPTSINDAGQVVGVDSVSSEDPSYSQSRPFIYTPGVGMQDLNDLLPAGSGWVLGSANAINDRGQITGSGTDPQGRVRPYLLTPVAHTWTADAISAGGDGSGRALWTHTDGTAALWRLDAGGRYTSQHQYGPFPGWVCRGLSTGPDNDTHALWTYSRDGGAAFWRLDLNNTLVSQRQYGPFPGWVCRNIAAAPGGGLRTLWVSSSGQAALWRLDASNAFVDQKNYGPFAGWTPKSLSVGPDGVERLLWVSTWGEAAFWRLDGLSRYVDQQHYGPFAGWSARDFGGGHALWVHTSGAVALWNLDPDDHLISQQQYGPFVGWLPKSLVVGADGAGHLEWTYSLDGGAAFWHLDVHGQYIDQQQYGPY